jgi:hypothetical protein
MIEKYLIEMPWICITYLTTDAEADANGGQGKAILDCCICGVAEEKVFTLPAEDDPVWATVDPQKGLPEAYEMRLAFQVAHLHDNGNEYPDPMMIWAKPLRNMAALKGGVNLQQLRERLMAEIGKAQNESN